MMEFGIVEVVHTIHTIIALSSHPSARQQSAVTGLSFYGSS